MVHQRFGAVLAFGLLASAPLGAQAGPAVVAAPPQGWLLGTHVAVPGSGGTLAFDRLTLGAQITRWRDRRPGLDAALGLAPRALTSATLALDGRFGLGVPVPLSPRVRLIPSAGANVHSVVSGGFGSGSLGYHLSAAAVYLGTGPLGIRTGLTWRRPFVRGSGGAWLLDVGVVRRPRGA